MTFKKTLSLAAAIVIAGSAVAQPGDGPWQRPHGPPEHSGAVNGPFAQPGDGPRGRPHGPPDPETLVERMMSRFDGDSDGLLTLDEFQTSGDHRGKSLFDRADQNGDGLLTLEEIQTVPRGPRGEIDREALRACIEESSGSPPPGPRNPEELFGEADTNDDGAIDQQEADAAKANHVAERFFRLDTNGDSAVSRDELLEGLKAKAERRKIFRDCRDEQLAIRAMMEP